MFTPKNAIANRNQSRSDDDPTPKMSTATTSRRPLSTDSVDRLRKLYHKTEEMKKESKGKNAEVENQFRQLRERLTTSSGFLNSIKNSIDNIKFSYQRDIENLEQVTEENRGDIDKEIEEIREHIGKLQSRDGEKEERPQNYQEALREVLKSFEDIARGKYSSHVHSNRNAEEE